MLDANVIEQLFHPDKGGQDAWVGEVAISPSRTEYVPFRYASLKYVMTFTHPGDYFGIDDAGVREFAPTMYTKGIVPDDSSRLIKFHRADVDATDPDSAYNPAKWPLKSPRQIFEFGDFLCDTVTQHALAVPETVEYYYMATNVKLERFYGRIFKKMGSCNKICSFEPILSSKGELYGYRKK